MISVSAIQRYTRNFITPGATIMIFLGSISVMFPSGRLEFEQIYDFIVDRTPGLILLIIIPQLLIFESGRKLRLEEIGKQIAPIGFFAITGVTLTILIMGTDRCQYSFPNPLFHGLLFGSIVAATDTVVAAAVFGRFSIPRRLNLILEGESPSLMLHV